MFLLRYLYDTSGHFHKVKVCLHVTDFSPLNAPFNGPFYLISIVFMKNRQNGFQPILSVF